jgi:uncharacterized protein DUF4011
MENNSILSKLESLRKELLDLGLRNSLLNYKIPAGKGVDIVQEKSMSFIGRSNKDESTGEFEFQELSQSDLESSYLDSKLQTNESDKKLNSRLLNNNLHSCLFHYKSRFASSS